MQVEHYTILWCATSGKGENPSSSDFGCQLRPRVLTPEPENFCYVTG